MSSEGCMETDWRGHPARQLFSAADRGDVVELKRLLKNRELRRHVNDLDGDLWGILSCYALNGKGEDPKGIVNALVDAGGDVNLRNLYQETPLLTATIYGRVEVVKALLERGACLHYADCRGRTPVSTAREKCKHDGKNDKDCCKILTLLLEAENRKPLIFQLFLSMWFSLCLPIRAIASRVTEPTIQAMLASCMFLPGLLCMAFPRYLLEFSLRNERLAEVNDTTVLIFQCFGAQACLVGIVLGTCRMTPRSYKAFAAAMVPFFGFNYYFHFVKPFIAPLPMLADFINNVGMSQVALAGALRLRQQQETESKKSK